MKKLEDMLPKEDMNVGQALDAVAATLALLLATSLPGRFEAMHATLYLTEKLTNELADLERSGEANWSKKDKEELQ